MCPFLNTPSVALLIYITFPLFSFQGAIPSFEGWWRITGSNRWPPECKSGALPAELIPHVKLYRKMVGPSGLEPPTLRLSVVRSSQLSYGPIFQSTRNVPSKLNNARMKRSDLRNITQHLRCCEVSLERRWSSRSFSNGYLVTTSPQLPNPPSAASSNNG